MSSSIPVTAQVRQLTWPRTLTAADGTRITLFQPQVESWSYYVLLKYRMAAEVLPPGATTEIPGILEMSGETSTDLASGTVALYNQKLVSATFPGPPVPRRSGCRH